eukprot:UN26181
MHIKIIIFIIMGVLVRANKMKQLKDDCANLQGNLTQCEANDQCAYYDITDRVIWEEGQEVEVYDDRTEDTGPEWKNGTVSAVVDDQLTVKIDVDDDEIEASRWSFRFRARVYYKEKVGMRVLYYKTEDTTEGTKLTNIADDEWSDLWVQGGMGNRITISPGNLEVSQYQDCVADEDEIEALSLEMAEDNNQVEQAASCTKHITT